MQFSRLQFFSILLLPAAFAGAGVVSAQNPDDPITQQIRMGENSEIYQRWTASQQDLMEKEFVPRSRGGMEMKEFRAPDARVKPFLYEQLFFEKTFLSQEFSQVRAFRSENYQTDQYDSGENFYQSDGQPLLVSSSNANIEEFRAGFDGGSFSTESARDAEDESAMADDDFRETREIPISELTSTTEDDVPNAADKPAEGAFPVREEMDINDVRDLLNKN